MENYETLGVIGEGTYGVVVKARHRDTGQIVAIKKFKESDEDEQVRKTSLREVRILKQLRHDNIISLLEVFRRKGKLYLVFEYGDNTILEVLEQRPGGLSEGDVRRYTYQLLRATEYCHAHNVMHRDIKPENILITSSGTLKLCDFGFARTMSIGAKYTDYVATRWYRSPELLVGDAEYSKGVDIWAIGCIFAEISNGMPLFPGESDLDQLAVIMKCFGKLTSRQVHAFRRNPLYVGVELPSPKELEPLDTRFSMMPQAWIHFLKACLKSDPDERDSCTSLMNLPYFTENNFRVEFEQELRMLFEKEQRLLQKMNGMRPVAVAVTATSGHQEPEKPLANPIRTESPTAVATPPPIAQPAPHTTKLNVPSIGALWAQYLASSAGGQDQLPDLSSKVQTLQTQHPVFNNMNGMYYRGGDVVSGGGGPPTAHSVVESGVRGPAVLPSTLSSSAHNHGLYHSQPVVPNPSLALTSMSYAGRTSASLPTPAPGPDRSTSQSLFPSLVSAPPPATPVSTAAGLGLSYKKKPTKRTGVLSTLKLGSYGSSGTSSPSANTGSGFRTGQDPYTTFSSGGGSSMLLQGHQTGSLPPYRRTSKPV